MVQHERDEHLSRISTMWTMIRAAHGDDPDQANAAMVGMIENYSGAVYRYLLGVLRNSDAADDVFQQFALRTVQGAFRRADPERGRFRDYLKVSVLRLVTDYHRGQRRAAVQSSDDMADARESPRETGDAFENSWRDELLARAWNALRLAEEETGQPFFSVLNYRSQLPDANSTEMAADLTEQLHPEKPYTDAGIRKTLQRARQRFADLLLGEVRQTLENADLDTVEQELVDLGLHSYCRSALARHRG